jgi:AraC-like DNA-binding protein
MLQSKDNRNGLVDSESCLAAAVGAYREWPAGGALAHHLACLWTHALPDSVTPPLQVVPDGCVDIIWTGDGLRVAGPDTRPIRESFPPGTVIVGMRFRPGAAPPWLGVPASEIVNGRLPLQHLWGADASRLADRLSRAPNPADAAAIMLSVLAARRPRASLIDHAAPAILAAIRRDDAAPMRILALAGSLDISERTLRRRCESAFGYGPKTLARILRFQQFLELLRGSSEPRLAELAATSGYADQAHLTREVRRLGGLTPKRFRTEIAA